MWHRFHVLMMIASALVVTAWAAGENASDRFYSAIRVDPIRKLFFTRHWRLAAPACTLHMSTMAGEARVDKRL